MRIIDELELLFRGVKNLRPFLNAITYLYGFAKTMNGLGDASQLYLLIGSLTLEGYDGSSIDGWNNIVEHM
jgi:hypothetical protein